jgi:hypothetical protein
MSDVHKIIDRAGQFHANLSSRLNYRAPDRTKKLEKWIDEKVEALVVKDVIVASCFVHAVAKHHHDENIIKEIAGKTTKTYFLNADSSLWEKIKGSQYNLCSVLELLKYNTDYKEIRDEVTNLVVQKTIADKSGELKSSVISSLVHTRYPAGRPDLIDQYDFTVNKMENDITYNMKDILPLIKKWKGHEFKNAIVARAFKCLLKEYANDLDRI